MGISLTVLDCESFETSIESLCVLYGANSAEVHRFLSAVGDDNLLASFEHEFGKATKSLDTVCWFHLSRAPAGTDFSEGILPLHLALDKIWRAIISIPNDPKARANLERLRIDGVPDYLYDLKTNNRLHSGPYAMLVRDSAFNAESMWNHDYLEFPEIIEDICNGYENRFGERIHEEICNDLRKCIVKFEIEEADGDDSIVIEPAIRYCWYMAHDKGLRLDANICYDARGVTVPCSAIRKVEFL